MLLAPEKGHFPCGKTHCYQPDFARRDVAKPGDYLQYFS